MRAEHGLVVASLDETIARVRQRIAYMDIRLNHVSGEDYAKAAASRRAAMTELALWLDARAYTTNNTIPSIQGQEAARSLVDGPQDGSGRPAWMESHYPDSVPATRKPQADGMPTPQTWERLQANHENPTQHPEQ